MSLRLEPKYPEVSVKLIGRDGNAFFIIGRVRDAMKKAGIENEEIAEFTHQATSADYDFLLRTAMEWVEVL